MQGEPREVEEERNDGRVINEERIREARRTQSQAIANAPCAVNGANAVIRGEVVE